MLRLGPKSLQSAARTGRMARMASSLVVVEHNNKTLHGSAFNALAAASKVGGDISVLAIGKGAGEVVAAAAKMAGVSRVLYAEYDAPGTGFLAESIAPIVVASQKQFGFTHIFAAATSVGKSVLPRVAGNLDVELVSDVIGVDDENTFSRAIYAGNVVLKVKSHDKIKVVTVRPTSFEPAAAVGGTAGAAETVAATEQKLSKFVSEEVTKSDRPELATAKNVVSGGRALKSKEEFMGLMLALADKMNAAVGASRAAVDAGYAPNEWQVGQTGKVVAPALYVAVGISGAIQHVAGMKDSKVIVAINKDPEAPIFQIADYGLEADLFTAVPELIKKL